MHNFFEKQMLWKERKSSKPVAIQKERLVNRHFSTNEFLYDLLTRLLLRLPELSYIFLALDSGIETNKYEDCQVTSVVSNSVRPHRRQPTRLLCPWDSLGKNNGGVAISFSNAWKWKVKMKLLSRVWLLATPWTAAYQAPPSMGFSRQEYWSGVPFLLRIWRLEYKNNI